MSKLTALSATVNQLMNERNLSPKDVAERSGLHISTVRRVINRTGKYVEPATALKLARGIDPSMERFSAIFNDYQARE